MHTRTGNAEDSCNADQTKGSELVENHSDRSRESENSLRLNAVASAIAQILQPMMVLADLVEVVLLAV